MINLGDGVEHPLNLSFNYRSFSLITIINYRFKRHPVVYKLIYLFFYKIIF